MADQKISGLPAASSVTADDLFEITNDPAGTPASQKATAAQIAAYVAGTLGNSAPLNVGTTAGTVAAGDDGRFTDTRIPTDNTVSTDKIQDGAVTNAKLAPVATATFKGRTAAGTGAVEDLTATQATALLNSMVGDSGSGGTKGLVPAPGSGDAAAGKFLSAGGTWAAPNGATLYAASSSGTPVSPSVAAIQGQVAIGDGAVAAGTGQRAISLGRSYASGANSLAACIGNNTNSYGAIGADSIALGYQSRTGAGAFCCGYQSLATGSFSFAGGFFATASGQAAFCFGGTGNFAVTASGQSAIAWRDGAVASQIGKFAMTAGTVFAAAGDAQTGGMILLGTTANATPVTATSDKGAAASNNQVILPNNSTYRVEGTVLAMQQASQGTDTASFNFVAVVRRGANAAATVLKYSSVTAEYKDDTNWTLTLSADTTNGGLKVDVTGAAGKNVRWKMTTESEEITYA